MTARSSGRLQRSAVEHALDGRSSSGVRAVDELLIAATARPTGFELNREAAAVATFRTLRRGAAPAAVAPVTSETFRDGVRPVRWVVAGAVATVLAGTGVALAATGNLPGVVTGGSDQPRHHASPAPSVAPAGRLTAKPHPSVRGLCRAYQAQVAHGGRPLAHPAFSVLVRRAGGTGEVASWCAALVGVPAAPSTLPPAATSGGTAPHGHPTGGTAGDPTGGATQPVVPVHPTHPPQPPTPTHKAHPAHPSHPAHPGQGPGAAAAIG
jgi:hypothetical protein